MRKTGALDALAHSFENIICVVYLIKPKLFFACIIRNNNNNRFYNPAAVFY